MKSSLFLRNRPKHPSMYVFQYTVSGVKFQAVFVESRAGKILTRLEIAIPPAEVLFFLSRGYVVYFRFVYFRFVYFRFGSFRGYRGYLSVLNAFFSFSKKRLRF